MKGSLVPKARKIGLDLRKTPIKVLRIILLQFDHHAINVEDEDIGPLFQFLRIALGEPDTLLGMQTGIFAVVHEIPALGFGYDARHRVALLEVIEVTDVLLAARDLTGENAGLVPNRPPLAEVAPDCRIEQFCRLPPGPIGTSAGYSSSPAGASRIRPRTASGQIVA
jgi:hypothetical protein